MFLLIQTSRTSWVTQILTFIFFSFWMCLECEICRCPGSRFPNFQISRFPDSQIFIFPDALGGAFEGNVCAVQSFTKLAFAHAWRWHALEAWWREWWHWTFAWWHTFAETRRWHHSLAHACTSSSSFQPFRRKIQYNATHVNRAIPQEARFLMIPA